MVKRYLLQLSVINKKPLFRFSWPLIDLRRSWRAGGNNKGFKSQVSKGKNKYIGLVKEWNQKETENSVRSLQENIVQLSIHVCWKICFKCPSMWRTERNWVLSKSHSEFNETIYNISLVLLKDEMHYFSCIIFLSGWNALFFVHHFSFSADRQVVSFSTRDWTCAPWSGSMEP